MARRARAENAVLLAAAAAAAWVTLLVMAALLGQAYGMGFRGWR